MPALIEALQRHLDGTNRLVDHPSFRICRFALIEVEEMRDYGNRCVARLVDAGKALRARRPGRHAPARSSWRRPGGSTGASRHARASRLGVFSISPRPFDGVPRRDERFPDPYNMGVHAEAFLYDPKFPPEPKTLMMYYKRLREIDVPEMMASIIAETSGKPWGYYVDMTRQLWDEARHAMMGEVGFRPRRASTGAGWCGSTSPGRSRSTRS